MKIYAVYNSSEIIPFALVYGDYCEVVEDTGALRIEKEGKNSVTIPDWDYYNEFTGEESELVDAIRTLCEAAELVDEEGKL